MGTSAASGFHHQSRIVSVIKLDLQRLARRSPDALIDNPAALEYQIAADAVMTNCGDALPERVDILSFDDHQRNVAAIPNGPNPRRAAITQPIGPRWQTRADQSIHDGRCRAHQQ